jgi:hypothetical protein
MPVFIKFIRNLTLYTPGFEPGVQALPFTLHSEGRWKGFKSPPFTPIRGQVEG